MAMFSPAGSIRHSATTSENHCIVQVQGYTRICNGKEEDVSGYERSNPHCNDNGPQGNVQTVQMRGSRLPPIRPQEFQRLLDQIQRFLGSGHRRTSTIPSARQSIRDILMPSGQPIGRQDGSARLSIRTLDGGNAAAREMVTGCFVAEIFIDITPPGYKGRLFRLLDGEGGSIGYRPTSTSGPPAVDISIPGLREITRLHFK